MTAPATFDDLGIAIPELASQGNGVLGIRDSGKTYSAMLLAERMFDAGVPFTAFDPIGVWRFIRVPGAGRGYPVVVAGGQDADLPLTPASAPLIVQAAMENGVSLVIDLFDMNLSKADWRRIVRDCIRLMLHRNKQHGLRHVFLEEAAEFAPQRVLDGEVYAEVEKLARMGGNSRLGYTLINQRAEEVNKAVLELCDNLFLHRQKGKNSLNSLGKWLDLADVADHKAIISSLPMLPQGECWAWLGGTDLPRHVRIPLKNSLHPDRRVMRGDVEANLAHGVDVGGFVAALQEVLPRIADDAKASDPKLLRAEIGRLTAALRAAEAQKDRARRERDEAKCTLDALRASRAATADAHGLDAARAEGERTGKALGIAAAQRALAALRVDDPSPSVAHEQAPADLPAPSPARMVAAPGTLSGAQVRLLGALKWWAALGIGQPTNDQVAFIAGYRPGSGGFNNLKGGLRTAGLIDYPAPGHISLTGDSHGTIELPAIALGRAGFHDAVRAKLSAPQLRLLDPVLEAWPGSIATAAVADAAGYRPGSGGFNNLRGSLRTLGLVDYPRGGEMRAADWLFPETNHD